MSDHSSEKGYRVRKKSWRRLIFRQENLSAKVLILFKKRDGWKLEDYEQGQRGEYKNIKSNTKASDQVECYRLQERYFQRNFEFLF